MKGIATKIPKLKQWVKPEPDVSEDLSDGVSVAKNGYIAIGSAFAQKFGKNASFMYNDDGYVCIKPVKEKSRISYTVSHLTGRSSCIINTSALVIELGIRPGRYKAVWIDNASMLLFKAELKS